MRNIYVGREALTIAAASLRDENLIPQPLDSNWVGARGRIDHLLLKKVCPKSEKDVRVFVCGPEAMFGDLCGPRGDFEVTGVLAVLGFVGRQVVKF